MSSLCNSRVRWSLFALSAATTAFGLSTAIAQEPMADPMRPPGIGAADATTPTQPRYVLQGTILASDRRLALINGLVVALGDRIGDAELVAVEKERVVLAESGEEIEIATQPKVEAPDLNSQDGRRSDEDA